MCQHALLTWSEQKYQERMFFFRNGWAGTFIVGIYQQITYGSIVRNKNGSTSHLNSSNYGVSRGRQSQNYTVYQIRDKLWIEKTQLLILQWEENTPRSPHYNLGSEVPHVSNRMVSKRLAAQLRLQGAPTYPQFPQLGLTRYGNGKWDGYWSRDTTVTFLNQHDQFSKSWVELKERGVWLFHHHACVEANGHHHQKYHPKEETRTHTHTHTSHIHLKNACSIRV